MRSRLWTRSIKGCGWGDILLDEVTSLTEDGSPLRETPAPAPMRMLLHVDTNGVAALLEHVTIMREQTADSELDAEVALVLDDSQIPFYVGIEERDGTLIGGRVETAAFDMPRLFDVETQAALVGDVMFAFGLTNTSDVTQSNIALFVNSRDSRPPALVEAYHTTWPLTGGLGANRQLGTKEPFEDVNGNNLRDEAEPFTDTNTNGMWDAAEPFVDTDGNETWSDMEPLVDVNSNNVWDAAEPFTDINSNGVWNAGEPFTDVNSNGVWDVDEPFIDSNSNLVHDATEPFSDLNTNGGWDAAEVFTDANTNGMWDAAEDFTDINSNLVWDTEEPFEDTGTDNGRWDPAEDFTDLNSNGLQDDSPLLLDPFHRSNPFRHAFHPSHGAGKPITRSLTITFDETQEVGYLRGTYTEVVTGLAAVPLVMRGPITLQQINDVGELR